MGISQKMWGAHSFFVKYIDSICDFLYNKSKNIETEDCPYEKMPDLDFDAFDGAVLCV